MGLPFVSDIEELGTFSSFSMTSLSCSLTGRNETHDLTKVLHAGRQTKLNQINPARVSLFKDLSISYPSIITSACNLGG